MIKDGRASPTRPASPDYPDRQQQHSHQQQQPWSMEAGGTRLGQRPPFVHASTSYYHLDTHAGSSNASSSSSPAPVVPTIVVIPYTDSDIDDEPRRSFAFPPHPLGTEGEKHGASDPTITPNGYGRLGRHETQDNHHHRHPPRLYTHRRVPSGLAETLSARWRSKWACWRDGGGGGGEGGLGRALMLGWVGTTLAFLLATALWRGQLFRGE